jgi:hypothetical protein
MNFSHHPGLVFVSVLWAWLDADKPVWSKIALLLLGFSCPHVSYAMLNSGSMPPQSRSIGCVEWKLSVWPDVYEGSGPEDDRFLERDSERDSWASRHGKERAGLDDSASWAAAACCALRGYCWWIFRTAWFDCRLANSFEGWADLAAKHCGVEDANDDVRARASRLRETLMADAC